MFGYTRSKDTGEVTGEIDRLRYSAYDIWSKSKAAYRERYYEGRSFQTTETVFGHNTHKRLEQVAKTGSKWIDILPGEEWMKDIPAYPLAEYDIGVEIGPKGNRVKIGGCIDSFDPETFSFLDYKTSHRNKDGKAPWDAVRVAKHTQLVFYSLLIKEKHGQVNPHTQLVWIETEFSQKTLEYAGHTLVSGAQGLSLTGEWVPFPRRITEWERKLLKEKILIAAEEIKLDFIRYKQANG